MTLLPRTTAFGWFPDNLIGLVQRVTDHLADPDPRLPRERLWHVRASRVVIAAGALERPLVFPGNDRPGVMLADAARVYLQRYGVKVGTRAVIATADDSAYAAGVALQRSRRRHQRRRRSAHRGQRRGAGIRPADAQRRERGRHQRAVCASTARSCPMAKPSPAILLLMCGGWTPSVHLYSQSRAQAAVRRASAGIPAGRMDRAGALGGRVQRHIRSGRVPGGRLRRRRRAAAVSRRRCTRSSRHRRPWRSLRSAAARHSSISRTT